MARGRQRRLLWIVSFALVALVGSSLLRWESSAVNLEKTATLAPESVIDDTVTEVRGDDLTLTPPEKDGTQPSQMVVDEDGLSFRCKNGYILRHHCKVHYLNQVSAASDKAGRNVEYTLCRPRMTQPASNQAVVLGIGHGTTGTRSLAYALSMLGLRVIHYAEYWVPGGRREMEQVPSGAIQAFIQLRTALRQKPEDCHAFLDSFNFSVLTSDVDPRVDALLDAPMSDIAWDLLESFPNARFLFTSRPAEPWLASRSKHKDDRTGSPYLRPCGHPLRELTNDAALALYNATDTFLRCVMAERLPPSNQLYLDFWANDSSADTLWTSVGTFVEHRNETLEKHCAFPTKPNQVVCSGPR